MNAPRRVVLESFGGPEVMRLEQVPDLDPGAEEVVVDVEVVGANFADTIIRRGEYLRDQPLSMAPGCEAIGHVLAAGEAAELEIGTRVAVFLEDGGAYAERLLAPADRAYPVPEDLPAEVLASIFLQGTTAHYAVHRYGRTQPGETVLVHAAAGGVGGIAVQLAKLAGARPIATASSPRKREEALDLGAEQALDSSDPATLRKAILAATEGRGADVVVDGVGGPLFEPSIGALGFGGRYVVFGAASQEASPLDARRLMVRGQTICGFVLVRIIEQDAEEPGRTLTELCDLTREGSLRPRIEALPFERVAEAHERFEARDVCGKIVLLAAARESE